MIRLKTVLRSAGIIVVTLWSTAAMAQSVLNFTARGGGAVGITNPTSYAADVKFTLYNADGSLSMGVLNPVSRRIPGKGQITAYYSRIFGTATGGWVQATSPVSGLQGSYFMGESASSFDTEATAPLQSQIIPYPIPSSQTSLIVTNPATRSTNVTVAFYDTAGNVVPGGGTFSLAAHAQVGVPGSGASARISADVGVLASAVQTADGLEVVTHGQGERSRSQRLVAPYFKNESGTHSVLVLNNPSAQEALARVTFSADSVRVSAVVRIRTNGSTGLDWAALFGNAFAAPDEGWLLVESDVPTSGLVVVSSKTSRTALPLQSAPADKMLFSRFIDGSDITANLSLVGSAERDATVTVTLSRPDGSTVASNQFSLPASKRSTSRVRDLLPVPDTNPQGFITVQSTTPIYGVEILETEGDFLDSGIVPLRLPTGYQPSAPVPEPKILGILVADALDGQKQLSITAQNLDNNPQVFVGGKLVPILFAEVAGNQFSLLVDIPALEPGYINVKIRSNGLDSTSYPLGVYPDGATFIPRTGQALFQKVEITNAGLDVSRTVMVPIRNARVEIIDRATGKALSVTETDENGMFLAAVPDRPGLAIQVLSRLRSSEVKVLDNTAGNRLYAIRKDFDDPQDSLEIVDTSRISGAFNILDAIQRANALVAQADPQLIPPPVTILWSEKNNDVVLSRLSGGFKSTFFNPITNTAYVLGDRNTDSDEFDDSVILHEYAHMLAARFSRDDSPGGIHGLGDPLDPRLAWSEGWATFFSSAVRGTSIFVDSKGPGAIGVRYDLEDNSPAGDRKGFYSEASVQGLLWDLFDEGVDDGDLVQVPFASIWKAFSELRNDRFVYLPDFLENFVRDNPGLADVLRTMANLRNIDFDPLARPSIVSSFPRPIAVGATLPVTDLDSFTSKRINLATSSHFYSFTTPTAGQTSIRLDIDGLGPANNPDANDLDLYLYDSNGKRIAQSNQFFNGQSEYILGLPLAAGTYYVEVRSFYTSGETNAIVYNSGRYRLSVQMTR